jgi:UDP-3-O-[3-hydroxymyristoyl] glucosamine N-acyltransferase
MFTLREIAQEVGGKILGDPDVEVSGVSPFEEASSGDITVAFTKRYLHQVDSTAASVVIVPREVTSDQKTLLAVKDPKLAFALILQLFKSGRFKAKGISSLASIGERCQISDLVSIQPFAAIGDDVVIEDEVSIGSGTAVGDRCRIGAQSTLHSNVTLYPRVTLGRRVILHSGTVIGADGFGYVFDGNQQVKVPQSGNVEIHDDVEIGANSCVDRATFGSTVIERGVKLDNHVHIAHNCRIGENTVIVGCVGISGSVTIGKNCILAGQCGTVDHVSIGDNVQVMARAVVTKDVPSGSVVSGRHGRSHQQELRQEALLRKLPEIYEVWKKKRKG